MEREAEGNTSAEEEATVAGEGGAGPCPAQEAVDGEDCPVPAGGQGEWVTVLSHQICTLPCPSYRDKG